MSSFDANTGLRWGAANTVPQQDYRITQHPSPALARDIRIDSLRGLMLAEITLVHIHSPFALSSYELFGRVSPAAGFVFLSGLVAGGVYNRAAQQGVVAVIQRCLRRALYIHVYHVVAFLVLLAVVAFEPRSNTYFQFAIGQSVASAAHALGWFTVWAYQPNLFDILPMYGLFVLCMPAALIAVRNHRGIAVLLVSFGIWLLAQIGLGRIVDDTTHFGFFQGDFNPFAWQLVFFSGLYFGHMHLFRRHRVVEARPALLALCLLVCIAGFTMRWNLLHWPASFGPDGWRASKQDYGPAYLVNFLAFSYLVYSLATRFPRAFSWPPLAFLGRHSIQVFSFQVVAVYLATPLVWRAVAHGPWASNALGAALVASLFAAAWWHSRWLLRRPVQPASADAP
jgi:hypothetical protein